jgi:membrane protein DedA with SNARE-associated domain
MNEAIQFLTQHGAFVLFAVVLAEQIGLPFPALPFLIAAGALIGAGQMDFGMAVGSAILAALMGDRLWFELGRRRGRRLLNRLGRISLSLAACVRWTEGFFGRYGARSLIVAKFVPGLNAMAPTLAGIVGLSLPQFLWYDSLGTMLWVGSGIAFGVAFSGELEQGVLAAVHVGPAVGLVLLGSVSGYVVYKALWRSSPKPQMR